MVTNISKDIEDILAIIVFDLRLSNVKHYKSNDQYNEIENNIYRRDSKEKIFFNKKDTEAKDTSLYKYKDYIILINSSIAIERSNVILQICKINNILFELLLLMQKDKIVALKKSENNCLDYEVTWDANEIFINRKPNFILR